MTDMTDNEEMMMRKLKMADAVLLAGATSSTDEPEMLKNVIWAADEIVLDALRNLTAADKDA